MPLGAPHEVCASPTSGLLRTSPLITNQVGPARRPQSPSYGLPFGQSVPQGRLRVRCIRASRHSILLSNVLLLTYSIIRRICTTVECTRGRGTDVESWIAQCTASEFNNKEQTVPVFSFSQRAVLVRRGGAPATRAQRPARQPRRPRRPG